MPPRPDAVLSRGGAAVQVFPRVWCAPCAGGLNGAWALIVCAPYSPWRARLPPMTFLAIDIGNTRLKWGLYASAQPSAMLLAHGAAGRKRGYSAFSDS